jgi:TolB-like protein
MSADPENEYFSNGITEEIINVLAKIKELKVTSQEAKSIFLMD